MVWMFVLMALLINVIEGSSQENIRVQRQPYGVLMCQQLCHLIKNCNLDYDAYILKCTGSTHVHVNYDVTSTVGTVSVEPQKRTTKTPVTLKSQKNRQRVTHLVLTRENYYRNRPLKTLTPVNGIFRQPSQTKLDNLRYVLTLSFMKNTLVIAAGNPCNLYRNEFGSSKLETIRSDLSIRCIATDSVNSRVVYVHGPTCSIEWSSLTYDETVTLKRSGQEINSLTIDTKAEIIYAACEDTILSFTYTDTNLVNQFRAKYDILCVYFDIPSDMLYFNDGREIYQWSIKTGRARSVRKVTGMYNVKHIALHDGYIYVSTKTGLWVLRPKKGGGKTWDHVEKECEYPVFAINNNY